ncbi:hypothetical protein L6475_02185 [Prevotella sp. E9-3]|uniref:FtsL-like putative cell division protein n=1 Tax=Prevotella sp. E9-3 TaxID=2913621 RepID=UPI001EDA48E5|nr:FtsL-like putative cell division protein [Prevotella sp. E9-3]UKK48802.1 hypothetical protein L6475_02185 [Prevotella sp. E9-3]
MKEKDPNDKQKIVEIDAKEQESMSTLRQLKESVTEDDDAPASSLSLRTILGGDLLTADMVRRQVWLCLLIALFLTVYVAFRYQCQQDMIDIAQLENQLTDAKFKALSSSSSLTERCRESHVLNVLRAHQDSTLHSSNQPPFKIYIPEQ